MIFEPEQEIGQRGGLSPSVGSQRSVAVACSNEGVAGQSMVEGAGSAAITGAVTS